ncbi:hypothetical protein DUNSADRAFT_18492 [Dunaliella salina]|uniref:Encoded protein n=1 Tax=Dunaliella salina TaxID=3046 RepID=A0ABQ7GYZ2_DUNSA|nr:hypothetical protein DUNSADRAFT_18492 [Dunaliella salina]|eukprot:KAF5839830.1 hypothetical protein DUNSADRAFT_18492 [Dunaliella salina]
MLGVLAFLLVTFNSRSYIPTEHRLIHCLKAENSIQIDNLNLNYPRGFSLLLTSLSLPKPATILDCMASVTFKQGDHAVCLKHEDRAATYAPSSCLCLYMCRECAQKMATGGKCKKCGALFAEVKRIVEDEAEGADRTVNIQLTKSGRLLSSQTAIRKREEPGDGEQPCEELSK